MKNEKDIITVGSFEIHPSRDGGYSIVRNGAVVSQQPTEEEAIAVAERMNND